MPAIARGSSARSRRRQTSEDNIEEGEPTQRSRAEDVEDDDDERDEEQTARRRAGRVTKGDTAGKRRKLSAKSGRKRRGRERTVEEEEGEEDEDQDEDQKEDDLGIDVENFEDQSLTGTDGRKITLMASDWQQVLRNVQETALKVVGEVAVAMAEAGESKDGEPALKELAQMDIAMRELLDTQAELRAHQTTLDEMANDLKCGDQINNAMERYEMQVESKIRSWQDQTTRKKYAKDDTYIAFKQNIYEVQYPDQAMPPMTEFIPREEDDNSDDDEIEVGGATQVYTCPLALTVLKDPMTSGICHHSFCKDSIDQYFLSNRSVKKKCPATGCNKMIGLDDFQPDKELEKKVKAHLRRERQRAAEADSENNSAEEIID